VLFVFILNKKQKEVLAGYSKMPTMFSQTVICNQPYFSDSVAYRLRAANLLDVLERQMAAYNNGYTLFFCW